MRNQYHAYTNDGGWNEFPTQAEVQVRAVADHVLDISAELFSSCQLKQMRLDAGVVSNQKHITTS